MATLYGTVEAWLRHPKAQPGEPLVLVTHPDTLARCLAEGWTVVEPSSATAPDDASPPPDAQPVRIASQRATGPSRAKQPKRPVKEASHGRA